MTLWHGLPQKALPRARSLPAVRRSAAVLLLLAFTVAVPASGKTAVTNTDTPPVAVTADKNSTSRAKCHALFDAILVRLHKVQNDVKRTPKFKTYHAAVGNLAKRYQSLNFSKLPSRSCSKSVSMPVTGAYIKHYLADQRWTDCRRRHRCATAMKDIKKLWAEARTYLKSADKGFSAVTAR